MFREFGKELCVFIETHPVALKVSVPTGEVRELAGVRSLGFPGLSLCVVTFIEVYLLWRGANAAESANSQ